ncbi:hypothetical protein JYU34_005622 [Plutella xylostella]|uniref:SHSP domain-containing protein n=2 Tax=Plutella xylostella TaxID=51655 RepID=A0ABQ7QTQ2_PLUXY|nr:protein lethal(2)essential for life [Plutella xylostella]KAG7308422.1 hypothetical protein JYU34_005622 [Plutella xylostella]
MSVLPYYDFDRMMQRMEREFFNSPFHQLFPRDLYRPMGDFFKPWDNVFRPWEDIMKPLDHAFSHLALQDAGSSITADDEKFQVNVDVQHFAPEEVQVKVKDREVMIEGRHEEKRDDHGYISRQFIRRYTLPEGCLPDTVVSRLSSDGVLTVTAPKVLPLPSAGERIIPITHTGPVQKRIGQGATVHEVK